MRIVNIGSLNLDYVYRVDTFPQPGETKSSRNLSINAGGKGLNQSIALAKAGCTVCHAGIYGAGGEMLVKTLQDSGVDTGLMQYRPDLQNGHAIIEVADSGQNSILLYGGTNQALTEDLIRQILDSCTPDSMILLQNETNFVGEIIEAASARHIPVAMNASPMRPDALCYDYGKLRWIVVNEIEAAALAGGRDFPEIMDRLSRKFPNSGILMTLGSQGAWLRDSAVDLRIGALRVENVVDTTAAGDTFLGYFLAGITSGTDPETVLQQATCASALAIQKPGAAQSIPDKATLLAFWEAHRHLLPCSRPV